MTTPEQPYVWCVVGNVVSGYHLEGSEGELRLGTKNFSPGTKVYCMRPVWGDGGERIIVLGRHRGGPKLVEMVVARKWLTNFRAKQIFHPYVIEVMSRTWDDTDNSKVRAYELAEAWSERRGLD